MMEFKEATAYVLIQILLIINPKERVINNV